LAGYSPLTMELSDAIDGRRTTNGPFRDTPVCRAHQYRLVDAASRAPSHFNSQPWRFVLIDDRATIGQVADISGESMTELLREGTFWRRYRPYFRFSDDELAATGDGILFDKMPPVLKPFRRFIFTDSGQAVMNRFAVPETIGSDNRALVAGSPLLLAALLDRTEYRPDSLSGFYSVFGLGAAIENVWLTTCELRMGIQFVSAPMEIPEQWHRLTELLRVPADLELMAVFRLGYVDVDADRPVIDWTSQHRKPRSHFVMRNHCGQTEPDTVEGAER
jgi:nitroreductase